MQEVFLVLRLLDEYGRQIVGVYHTLEQAQNEAVLAVLADERYGHEDVEIVRLLVGQRWEGLVVCTLGWDRDTKRVFVRSGEPLHTEGG